DVVARRRVDQLAVGVAADVARPAPEGDQPVKRRRGHRAGRRVAADQHDVGLLLGDLLEHRVQCGQVAVDVVDRRDTHPFSLTAGDHGAGARTTPATCDSPITTQTAPATTGFVTRFESALASLYTTQT